MNHYELIKEGIEKKLVMKVEYKDKKGNVTQKLVEPFVMGESIKTHKIVTNSYQIGGDSTSGKNDFKTMSLDSYISIELTNYNFDPKARTFKSDNPINNVELIKDTIIMVDLD